MLSRLAQLYYDSDISPKYVERCLSKNMQGTRFVIERTPSEEIHDEVLNDCYMSKKSCARTVLRPLAWARLAA